MPTRKNKRTYIGGTTSEARKNYFNYDKELTQVVTNLANSYGISPALVIDRLSHEGLIDRAIINNNLVANGNVVDVFGSSLFSKSNNKIYNSPYGLLGLDNIYDTYVKGVTKTKRPINIKKSSNRNESGEIVNSGITNNLYDSLELFTAELASRRNQVKQQYPNLTDMELDSATAARYNATNRYFKQLMDSGEYKTKYPIDVEGINIPQPNKTNDKYITNQNINIDFDETFRKSPYKDYVYRNSSYNPHLFLEDGYVVNPNGFIEQRIMRNIINNNFSHPDKVSTYIDWYKYGGRRKAQLGLDIREGGIAIPIAHNMYYMKGRSHDNGGIAIGPNNKNGLEVEGGEVIKVGKNDVKVFSSVPLLQGVSPAQLVMGGANPNKVFNAQEEFKDRNRINDDGTTYEIGGQKTININDMPSVFRGQKINGRYVQLGIPPATNKANKLDINFKQRLSSLNDDMKDFIMDGIKYGQQILPKSLRKYYAKGINILNSPGVHDISNAAQKITQVEAILDKKKAGGIYIKPSKRGTFTAAATKHDMSVQEFASKVLANKEDYSPAMVKKANFARNAGRWKKEYGGNMIYEINGNIKNGLMSLRPKAQYGKEKKINNDIKIGDDNLIYKRGIDGNWYTDGTTYEKSKYYMREKPVLSGGKRSDGTVVKPKTKSQALPELVVTAPKLTTKENKAITEPKTYTISGKTENYLTGQRRSANRHPVPEYIGKRPEIDNKKESVKVSTKSTPRKGNTQTKSVSVVDNGPKVTRSPHVYTNYKGETKIAASPYNNVGVLKNITGDSSYDVSQLGSPKSKAAKAKLNTSSTGGGTQAKDGRWVGQYKATNAGDWIGLGSNVLGSLASYFITKNAINKMPDPIKPVMVQPTKLKTRYNIEPQLTNVREAEQMNRASVRRNTASSNTSLAREQRLVNESRGTRNQLYGQKENIETQLINQDRLNRQSVRIDNVRTYNNYLNKLISTRQTQNQLGISNINNLIYGLTGSVNNILGNIESRKATNNTIRAIAAANPNVDARLIGGFDYYIDPITKKKYNKNQQYVRTING